MAQINRVHPFPPFEPDKIEFNARATDNTLNALPRADGWGPFPCLEILTAALGSECKGAIYFKDASGNVAVFAATATDIYQMSTASSPYTWTEVSKSTAAYSIPTDQRVTFLVHGDYVYANNLGTTPQKFQIGVDSKFSDNTDMPQGRYMWRAGDYVCVGNLTAYEAYSFAWSGIGDGTFFTFGQRGSDIQDIPFGGEIHGAVGHERGAIILLRDRMVYQVLDPSSGFTFSIAPANDTRGTVSGLSIAQIGPLDFVYYSEDGFFRGVEGVPIGNERIDRWFEARVDTDNLENIRAVVDPFEKIVWWKYPLVTSGFEMVGWKWPLDRWCRTDSVIEEAAVLASSALTWDGMDDFYATIDDFTAPWDSRAFKGGRPAFAAFNTDHKMGFFTGDPMAATLETADIERIPGRRSLINDGRVLGNSIDFTAQIGTKDHHGDDIRWRDAVSPSSTSGRLPVYADGLTHRARINLAAGANWELMTGIYLEGPRGGNL